MEIGLEIEYRMTCDRINHKEKKGFGAACNYCEWSGYESTTGFWWSRKTDIIDITSLEDLVQKMENIDFIEGSEGLIVKAHRYKVGNYSTIDLRTYKDREPQIKKERAHLHKDNIIKYK